MNDKDKKETIYYALSLPGDDPPDYTLTIDKENSKVESANQDSSNEVNGGLTQFFINVNLYIAILNKELDMLVQRINHSDPKDAPVLKFPAPNKTTTTEGIPHSVGHESLSNSLSLESHDNRYGLDDDPDLDEWMFFDLMDDD